MIAKEQLVPGKTYYIYSFGGCVAMEIITRRTFVGLSLEGEPMFSNKHMGNTIYNSDIWIFTRTLDAAQYA